MPLIKKSLPLILLSRCCTTPLASLPKFYSSTLSAPSDTRRPPRNQTHTEGGIPGTSTDSDPILDPERIQRRQRQENNTDDVVEHEALEDEHPYKRSKTPSPFSFQYFQEIVYPQGDAEKMKEWFMSAHRVGKDQDVEKAFNHISPETKLAFAKTAPSWLAKILVRQKKYKEVVQMYEGMKNPTLPNRADDQYMKAAYVESLIYLGNEDKAIEFMEQNTGPNYPEVHNVVLLSTAMLALSHTGQGVRANMVRKRFNYPPSLLARDAMIHALIAQEQYDLAFIHYCQILIPALQAIESERFMFSNATLYAIRDALLQKASKDVKERLQSMPALPPRQAPAYYQSALFAHL